MEFDSINFDDEIIEKEFKPIERVDIYRRNRNKAPRKVLKMREEEDAKHERDKILKDRYDNVISEAGKRVKWDYEMEDENRNDNKNVNENNEEQSRTSNRAFAITHSLLSAYPQSLYE